MIKIHLVLDLRHVLSAFGVDRVKPPRLCELVLSTLKNILSSPAPHPSKMRSETPDAYVRWIGRRLMISRKACITSIRNIVLPPDLEGRPKDTLLLAVKLVQGYKAPEESFLALGTCLGVPRCQSTVYAGGST